MNAINANNRAGMANVTEMKTSGASSADGKAGKEMKGKKGGPSTSKYILNFFLNVWYNLFLKVIINFKAKHDFFLKLTKVI